jgi:hypothetical protein
MRAQILVFLAFATILTFSTLAASAQLLDPAEHLPGCWEWDVVSGGIGGWVFTPTSEGYTAQVEFLPDGTLIVYRDEAETGRSTWSLDGSTIDIEGIDFVAWAPLFGPATVTISEVTGEVILVIEHPCCDMWIYELHERGPIPPVGTERRTMGWLRAAHGAP